MASKNRWDEAAECWREVGGDWHGLASRGLALHHWRVKKDTASAAHCFARATAAPCGVRTLIEAEMFFEEIGDDDARLALFERQQSLVEGDSRAKLAFVKVLLAVGRAREAYTIMRENNFSLCEGKMLSRELYEQSCAALASQALTDGNFKLAAEYYLQATEYPENIGIGKPAANKEARWYLRAGEAYARCGMEPEAQDCYQRGKASGNGIDIDFFPLRQIIWEAEPTKPSPRCRN